MTGVILREALVVPAFLVAVALAAPARGQAPVARVPVVGGPCEGCEAVFQGLPAEPASFARIAPAEEAGNPLRIEGTVTWPDGTPAPGTIVYAYHTDAGGLYPPGETRHGALRAWAAADGDGWYGFDTIRPGGYPGTDIPRHVHLHVIEPGRCTYFIDDVVFRDDPRLTPRQLRAVEHGRGGSGAVAPHRDPGGTWVAKRDIPLGEGIRDYPPPPVRSGEDP